MLKKTDSNLNYQDVKDVIGKSAENNNTDMLFMSLQLFFLTLMLNNENKEKDELKTDIAELNGKMSIIEKMV